MQYLAEVKKQHKSLIGGAKTELKLLAFQRNDQTWNAVPKEEIVACDHLSHLGEGALVLLNLSETRQIRGTPELAGPRLVGLLQRFSRLSEKSKDQDAEIEQWKQSLTYQSQELARREGELETRLEQLEQMEADFGPLEKQRQELETAWDKFRSEQRRPEFDHEQSHRLREVMAHLSAATVIPGSLEEPLNIAFAAVNEQQGNLDQYWQQLNHQKTEIEQRRGDVEHQTQSLNHGRQEWQLASESLENTKRQMHEQQATLKGKQERLETLDLHLQNLQELITRLITEGVIATEVDLDALENMSLGDLKEIVNNLRQDLEKLSHFVNDQEEELALQCQAVQELQDKLNNANDFERLPLEQELAYEQERMGMLNETLFGQRRNLRERQEVLRQHLRVVRRRQGLVELEDDRLELDPLIKQLEAKHLTLQQQRQNLEAEIEQLSNNSLLQELQQQSVQHQDKERDLQEQEANWQQAQMAVAQLQSRLAVYEETLEPLQAGLNEIRQKLEEIKQLEESNPGEQPLVAQMKEVLSPLIEQPEMAAS